jgi:hypothetical protein
MGLEGLVSKHRERGYRAGTSPETSDYDAGYEGGDEMKKNPPGLRSAGSFST